MTRARLFAVLLICITQPLLPSQKDRSDEAKDQKVYDLIRRYNALPRQRDLQELNRLLSAYVHGTSESVAENVTSKLLLGPHSCAVLMYLDTASSRQKRYIEEHVAGEFAIEYGSDKRSIVQILDSVLNRTCRSYKPSSLAGVKANLKKWGQE